MAKMKASFVIRVDAETELNEMEVEKFNQYKAEGKPLLKIDMVKREVANTFGIDEACVEVVEHSETLVEGIGE